MANRYWVGGTGNWTSGDTSHWSATSGGASGASFPVFTDNVFFDTNSFSADGQTVTAFTAPVCNNLDLSAINHTVNFAIGGTDVIEVHGNLIGSSNVTDTCGFSMIPYSNTVTLTTNAMILFLLGLSSDGGSPAGTLTVTAQDNIVCNQFTIQNAIVFNANNFNLTAGIFNAYNTSIVTMGSGILTLKPNSSSDLIFFEDHNSTVTITGSIVIDLSLFTGTTATFRCDQTTTLGNITINGATLGKTLYFDTSTFNAGAVTINNPPVTIEFSAGRTYTFTSLTANGSVGHLFTFISDSSGVQSTISAGTVSLSYIDVKDNKASGAAASFYDYPGGIDSTGNTNWLFVNPHPNFYLQNVFLVGSDLNGDVQTLQVGKDDDGTPIYYELETQPLNFGNRSHLKKMSDEIAVLTKNGQDSSLMAKVDQNDYKAIPLDLSDRVNIGHDISLEGKEITFKWSGESSNASPVFEGLYIENIDDLGMTNK